MQRLNNYRDLVKAVIDDVAHDKIQAYEVMQVAGKTGANLKSDDSLLRQRRGWAAGRVHPPWADLNPRRSAGQGRAGASSPATAAAGDL